MEISIRKQGGVCIASVMMAGRRYDLARAPSAAVARREAELKLQGALESAIARSNPSHYSRRDAMRIFAAANNGRVEKGSGEYIDQHGRSAHVATEALKRAWEARQRETRPGPRSNPSWGVDGGASGWGDARRQRESAQANRTRGVNRTAREYLVRNDEGWYRLWQRSRLSLRNFADAHKEELDAQLRADLPPSRR